MILYSKEVRIVCAHGEDDRRVQDCRAVVVPDCCEDAKRGHVRVRLRQDMSPCWFVERPQLAMEAFRPRRWWPRQPEPKFCLFCGTALPGIQLRQEMPKGPVWSPGDWGQGCRTCTEAASEDCLCWSPVVVWETVK